MKLRILAVLAAILAAWLATDAASQTTGTVVSCTYSKPTLTCDLSGILEPTWTPTSAIATPSQTPSPTLATSTPTFIATASATGTPTYTPTTTATPSPIPTPPNGNSIASILFDSNENCVKADGSTSACYQNNAFSGTPLAPHDGALCVPSGYSWARVADVQLAQPDMEHGYVFGTGWGVFQWPCSAGRTVTSAGVTVSVQNVRAYALGSGGWKQITFSPKWCSLTNTETNLNLASCPLGGMTGPTWAMPVGQVALHWASDHNSLPAGTVCGVTMYQARASSGVVLADAGLDWWSGSSNRGAIVGRYHRLTTEWQWINASTCSAAQITASPPPLQ